MKTGIQKGGLVLLGGIFQGLGMGLFLFPQSIPSGGAGGLAILLNYYFYIPMGPSLWIVNFVLLLAGINYLGKRFAVWTVVGMTVASLTIDVVESFIYITNRNLIIDLIFGSFFLGIGVGLLMRQGVSNGGMGVMAYMIAHRANILPGKPLFIFNCSIFFITAAVISWRIMILAFISQWISTKLVDFICNYDPYETYTIE
ncbi:YitT family protein [Pseudogracilibacillus sp. SE30717A]|uniref:YitT family protein n=1 Tax=Pseudogracilibacillus sp. SE30717A TaxID=3098293 RepID=UPI00300E435E